MVVFAESTVKSTGTKPIGKASGMRRDSGSAQTWGIVIIVVVLLSVGLGYTFIQTKIRENKLAMFQVNALITRVQSYREDVGRWPESLDELAAHLPPGSIHRVDPWGGAIRYQLTGDTYRLISHGRDGVPSDDDIEYSSAEDASAG